MARNRVDPANPRLEHATDSRYTRDARHDPSGPPPPPRGVRLVMLGRPGAGKGTQSARLAKTFGLAHIAVGDVLRAAVRDRSPLGRVAEPYLSSGRLLPDDVVITAVEEAVDRAGPAGFVLDGFPRTVHQAEMLDTLLELERRPLDAAVDLVVHRAVALRRMLSRWVCAACGSVEVDAESAPCPHCGGALERRSDDLAETIGHRLTIFDAEAGQVNRWYSERGLLHVVDGHGPVDDVARRVRRTLSSEPGRVGLATGTFGPYGAWGHDPSTSLLGSLTDATGW